MPELPEVETVVRDLRPCLVGRRITSIHVGGQSLRRPWLRDWDDLVMGRRFTNIRRRGKWIVVDLDDEAFLVVHLGMTGQLVVKPAREPWEDHTHIVFGLNAKKEELRFRDIRRFGSVTRFADAASLGRFFAAARLGPEPFDLPSRQWQDCLGRTRRPLKAVLLDQQVVAGVGNIYADESLYEARLHPAQESRLVSASEAQRLRRAVVAVLNRAIERRGSSIRDYVDGSGLKGGYQQEFRVYGRTGQPCCRCGAPIERIRITGRSTHFCPCCQKRAEF